MTLDLLERSELLPAHVARGRDPSVLGQIMLPPITMAVWERDVPESIAAALRHGLPREIFTVRLTGDVRHLEEQLPDRLADAGMAPETARLLVPDMMVLARHFAAAMRHDLLDLRLERITGDACRKFHADYVTARLVTTYVGRATQWLDQSAARRLAAGEDPAMLPYHSLKAGDAALLKGRQWSDDRAIVHRSPPIAGTGEERLLMVINPASRPQQAA